MFFLSTIANLYDRQFLPVNLVFYYFLYCPEEETMSTKYEAKLCVQGHPAWKRLSLDSGSEPPTRHSRPFFSLGRGEQRTLCP